MSTWANTPRFLPRALVLSVSLALLFVFVFSVPAFAVDYIVNDDAGCNDSTGSPSYCHIQTAIDAAAPGETIKVYPGNYSETAANRTIYSNTGPYQFGIFINKEGLLIQGVDANGAPIIDPAATLAYVTTNATNTFGPSGIWVEGDNVTVAGIKVGPNASGENKTIEIIGDNFTLRNSRLAVPGGGSVYLNDWRYDTVNNQSYLKAYTIEGNLLEFGTSIDINNGAGLTGPVSGRQINNNKFVVGPGVDWAVISFTGSDTGVPWFVKSVGGAIVTGNEFVGGQQLIRARGTYDNSQFNWESYWNDNTFDRAAVTLVGASLPSFDVRTYSYPNSYGVFNNVRRIGALVQPEIVNAAPGDTILIDDGLYVEDLTVNKHIKLVGAGSSSDAVTNTVLRRSTGGSALALSGNGASNSNPILLKDLRIEPMGQYGINLGNAQYVRLENVQVAGSPGTNVESEVCLKVATAANVSDLTVLNSGFSNCDHGWYFAKDPEATGGSNVRNVYVANTSFANNGFKGIYAEKLSDATFVDCSVTGNGSQPNWNDTWNGGIDINLKGAEAYKNLTFQNLYMAGNGLGFKEGAALMIKARDDAASYNTYPASLTNVTIEGGIFTGNERGIRLGEPGKSNLGPLNVQIHNAAIYGNNKTYAGADGSLYGGVVNQSQSIVDAINNWWGAISGPSGDGTGTGDAVRHASAVVLFNPFLASAPTAALIVPGAPIDLPTGATSFTLPVEVNPAAGNFSSTAFSLDYDTTCLSINAIDGNGDGIPDAISGLPGGFVNSVMLDTNDSDGELDVAMWDVTPPLASLPAGTIVKIKFDILPACQGPADKTTYVKFSSAPTATFSNANGYAIYRATQSADPLLLDYNQAPTDITLSPGTVAENAPAGTEVGTLTIVDPDGDAPVYSIVPGCPSGGDIDNAAFAIAGGKLVTAASFNFEAGSNNKKVCVKADDGQGGAFPKSLLVTVTDVNEPPTGIALTGNTVWEGVASGTLVGTLSTNGDPDAGQTHTYSLISGDGSADNSKFAIAGDQLKTAVAVDFATQSVYYIRVRSQDNGTPFQYVEKQFVINVLDHSLLSIGDDFVVRHGQAIGIPVVFTANGNAPTSASFSVSYNAACLTYVGTSGGTGSAAGGIVTVVPAGPFNNGTLATINFSANLSCPSGTSVPLAFTAASLNGGALPVNTDDGKVLVISNSARGDCNSDGFVNAGDFSAIVLETFDADQPWWLNAPQSTFPGSPVGCDANASTYIDVADVVCTVLVVFGNSSCTGGTFTASAATEPAILAVEPAVNDQAVEVPVTLNGKGATVAGAAFTLTYDPQQATFDTNDADGDGLPDAVVFATGSSLKRSVSVDAASGRIKIAVYGLSLPLPTVADGLVATVRLQAQGDRPLNGLSVVDAALGNDAGSNTPVEVEVNGAASKPLLYLPAVSN